MKQTKAQKKQKPKATDFDDDDISFDSSNIPKEEREAGYREFIEYRKQLVANQTPEDIITAKMMQLKLILIDYIQSEKYDPRYSFGYFLKEYITRQEKKNSEFAKDLNISVVELSQLVNRHRDPSLKIMIRLEAHSNMSFPAVMWFNVHAKEKALELLNDDEMRKREGKLVKKRLSVRV